MNLKHYYKSVVKIYSQTIDIDWQFPFKFSNANEVSGSGFFINKNGYLLTCSHVVESAKKIYIEVQDEGNQKYEVSLVGFCPDLDIALLKTVNYKPKSVLALGYSKNITVGDIAYAVGFPLGLDNIKMTKGVISGRQFGKIQMDTPISGGNSGGPLIYKNKVIGINSSSYVGNSAQNINFAVPIEQYYIIKDELEKNLFVRRSNLGALYYYTTKDLLSLITKNCTKHSCNSGIYVVECFKNSPLYKAGVRNSAIISKIDGMKIDNKGQLFDNKLKQILTLSEYQDYIKLGTSFTVEYTLKQKEYKKKAIYFPFYFKIDRKYPIYEKVDYEIVEGLVFMNLCLNHLNIYPNLIMRFQKFKNRMEPRIIISGILPGSFFSVNNLLSGGMLIKKVNDITVNNINELRNAIKTPIVVNKNKYIKIETEIGIVTAMNLKNLNRNNKNFKNVYKLANKQLLNSKNNKKKVRTRKTNK